MVSVQLRSPTDLQQNREIPATGDIFLQCLFNLGNNVNYQLLEHRPILRQSIYDTRFHGLWFYPQHLYTRFDGQQQFNMFLITKDFVKHVAFHTYRYF